MKIALAQVKSHKGDLIKNIRHHQIWIEEAAANGADLVVFPELSLTGYEPRLAKRLALHYEDPRLEVFQTLCQSHNLTIGVGLPTIGEQGILISLIFFQPQNARMVYSKQHLHKDELPYFVPGEEQVMLHLDGLRIAPAICYESLLPEHAEKVAEIGVDLYLSSVAKSEKGTAKAYQHYPIIARQLGICVLMVNGVGPCDDFVSNGKTGAWNKNGELIGQLGENREGILLIDTRLTEGKSKIPKPK
jgi:predicted amidohydrolase